MKTTAFQLAGRALAFELLVVLATGCAPNDLTSPSSPEQLAVSALGVDITRCSALRMVCDGNCIDPAADEFNCGACGVTCPLGVCMSGACVDPVSRTPVRSGPTRSHRRVGDPVDVAVCDVLHQVPTNYGTPFFASRPYGVHVGGSTLVHLLVNDPGTRAFNLYRHGSNGTRWERIGHPDVTDFFALWGVAGVEAPASQRIPARVFAVSVADGRLRSRSYLAGGGEQWEVAPPTPLPLINEPMVVTVFSPIVQNFNAGAVTIAVRTNDGYNGRVLLLTIDPYEALSAPDPGRWRVITATADGPELDSNTAIAMAPSSPGDSEPVLLGAVTRLGQLAVWSGTWRVVGPPMAPGGLGEPTTVEASALQIRTSPPRFVMVLRQSDGRLHLATYNGTTFRDLSLPPYSAPDVSSILASLLDPPDAPREFASGVSDRSLLFVCEGIFGGSQQGCRGVGQPTDSRSGVRPGSWYDAANDTLYTVGALAGASYLYSLHGTDWRNLLATRVFTSGVRLDLGLPGAESVAQEFFGNVLIATAGARHEDVAPGYADTPIYESRDDGNCWSAPCHPFAGHAVCGGGDYSLGFDAGSRAWATAHSTSRLTPASECPLLL